ncbi:MAG: amidohydrolase family protein [Planctomycetota bacterium]
MSVLTKSVLSGIAAAGCLVAQSESAQAQASAVNSSARYAVVGEMVHTMAGEPLKNGMVLIEDGRITQVGPAGNVPDGVPIVRAKVVTPGFVDAHSTVGLSGVLNVPQDQDQLESSSPLQPELRAIDAYHARDPLVAWVRSLGVTTVHTGHGPGALVSGQTMVVKTHGRSADADVLTPFAMVAATLADAGRSREGKAPGTRAKSVSMLREALLKAKAWAERRARDADTAMDLRHEALAAVLSKKVPLLVTAHRAHDLASALRIAKEFDIRVVLDGAAEAYLMLPQLRAAGVTVLPHPAMARTRGDLENGSMELANLLHAGKVPFALQTGFEAYVPKTRVLVWEAGVSVQHGLPTAAALEGITIGAARALGIETQVGSLEVGKHADLALFDGDPFEYTSHCLGVFIDGIRYEQEPR